MELSDDGQNAVFIVGHTEDRVVSESLAGARLFVCLLSMSTLQ